MPGLIGKKIGMTSVFSADGKNIPVAEHTMKLMSTLHGCMTIGHFANIFTPNDARIPNITPISPPVTLSNTASMRNWLRISIPRAPTDIRRNGKTPTKSV